jgi:hypothetical protein
VSAPVGSYKELPVPTDLAESSLAHAVGMLKVVPPVTLYVHPDEYGNAKRLLKMIGADSENNPLSPYLNLLTDPHLSRYGWYVRHGEDRIGSAGA